MSEFALETHTFHIVETPKQMMYSFLFSHLIGICRVRWIRVNFFESVHWVRRSRDRVCIGRNTVRMLVPNRHLFGRRRCCGGCCRHVGDRTDRKYRCISSDNNIIRIPMMYGGGVVCNVVVSSSDPPEQYTNLFDLVRCCCGIITQSRQLGCYNAGGPGSNISSSGPRNWEF
jgi:hypothetical protein